MGLDIYSGPLCRYYSGDWETENARASREGGFRHATLRPQPWAFARPAEAREDIEDWRIWLQQEWRPALIRGELAWAEDEGLPYLTYKIDYEGLHSLVFFLCCLQSPSYKRPERLPEDFEHSRVYNAACGDYTESHLAALEAHAYLPSQEDFLMPMEDPVGNEIFITSTSRLRAALDWINARAWNADRETLEAWLRGHLPADALLELDRAGDLCIVDASQYIRNNDRLEHAAQYAFAVLSRMLAFSEQHNVPIRYDW